jgi:DNA-binding beta-propeller fold protein YncE
MLSAPDPAAAAPGDHVESFGPDGTAATQFSRPAALAVDQETGVVYVGDSETQTLYKFDEAGNPLDWGGSAGYISGNELTGLSLETGGPGTAQVAVDSETHVVYVTSANKVTAFEADGEPHNFTEGPGAGTNQIPGATELLGLAVDAFGNIYASDRPAQRVRIYSRSGALITEFEPFGNQLSPLKPNNLALAPDGTLYVLNSGFGPGVYALEPSESPVTSGTTYGPGQPLQPSAFPTSVAVDPLTEYVYVGGNCYTGVCELPTHQVAVYDETGQLLGYVGTGEPGALKGSLPGLGVDGAGKKLYAAVRNEGGGLSQVSVYETFQFPEGPPTISGPSITNITSTTAELRARINPHTLDTTYQFEYGTVDCTENPGSCTKVPAAPTSIGSGHTPVLVTAQLSGLTPGTRYFFRVVAKNSEGTEAGPVSGSRSFLTQVVIDLESRLGDGRVWELVTPSRKFGGVMTNGVLVQAAADGSGIAFQTRGSVVEDPEGNRALEPAAALARRSASGAWSTSDLVPRHTEAGGLGFGPEFKMFSTDLGHALLEPRDDTQLSEEASERGPYLRTNSEPPVYRPLVTTKEPFANVPAGTVFGGEANGARNPVAISGANPSLTHVVISSKAALVAGAEERSLYLWSDGAIEAVSELPAAEATPGTKAVTGQLGSAALSVRNAVSEDGSRVFWASTDFPRPSLKWPALYLRDTVADETFRLDKAKAGATKLGAKAPAFMAASAEGSVVFFTDSQQLVKGASPGGRDLYRCVIGQIGEALGCKVLEDLSAPLVGTGENGEAEELAVGVAEDGSSLYFIARGVLDEEENEEGEKAAAGAPNLYLWQEEAGVRFLATLSEKDAADWGSGPPNEVGQAARGAANNSPDGRFLTFMSQENLAGSETADPESGKPVEQAFLYDSAEEELLCISCNPSGATDPGHLIVPNESEGGVIFPDRQQLWSGRLVGATLPETTEGEPNIGYALYWPRGVLNNGRAYFNSTSPLVAGDSNGTWDVYQYEPFGVGDCEPKPSAGSKMVATTETGCVSLISGGSDPLPSVFLDSSTSGDDVFLATFARLSALDADTDVDVYDARVGGVEAVVVPPPDCTEACQQRGVPPGYETPKSATFNGPVDPKPKPKKHCKKGQRKVKRHGKVRCVANKKLNQKKGHR